MQIPERVGRRPRAYNEEIEERRRQERLDERLARRLQTLNMEEDDEDDDYQGGIGDILGIGNGQDHHMNQTYVRRARDILTRPYDDANAAANYVMGVNRDRGIPPPARQNERYPAIAQVPRQPPPPVPVLRRLSMRAERYNSSPGTRPSERILPRRSRVDYASEAARHAPAVLEPRAAPAARASGPSAGNLRDSILAGLGGAGRGSGRVSAWAAHVEAGVEPEEGLLSM